MTATTIRVQMAQRKDTAAGWTAANPILLLGEIGYETDAKKFKIGDGSTNWNSLAYLPIPDGSGNLTITGNLEIGATGSLTFEGSTANGFETTLAVTDPTADRTITLPDVTGTVITTGDTGSVTSTMLADGTIVNADINASAEIAVSKLANGTANQVLVTDGTDVSWSDNLTLAGDLTVNGTTTTINTQDLLVEDKNIIIGNVDTPSDVTADGGGITLKGSTDKTINWIDATDAWTLSENVNIASGKEYRIDGTKVLDATSLGSAVVSSSLTSVGTIGTGTWQGTAIDAAYLDSTIVTTGDTGTVTSTMIADGTIVDADISASAEIAVSKLADGAARQLLQTDAAGTGVEWADNIDVPGTLDVTGAATFDSTATVTGVISANGKVSFPLGTAALPSLYPGSDVNTGIYSPGADQLAISTNGTGWLFIDASGNVRVQSPTALGNFTVGNGSGDMSIALNGSGSVSSIMRINFLGGGGGNPSAGIVYNRSANALLFQVGNAGNLDTSERLRITSDGKLGLGTSSVSKKLQINYTDNANHSTSNGTYDALVWNTADISTYPTCSAGIQLRAGNTSAGAGSIHGIRKGPGNQGELAFAITDSSGNNVEKARFTSTGLGIGTQTPGALIDTSSSTGTRIRSTYTATGGSRDAGFEIYGDGAANSSFVYGGNTGTTTITSLLNVAFNANGTERARLDSSGTFRVRGNTSNTPGTNDAVQLNGSAPANSLLLDASGRLLVGTTSDSGGALLQVNGNRIRIATAKTPASATDTGTTGEICWDADYIYVCTATNTWKRTAIATW